LAAVAAAFRRMPAERQAAAELRAAKALSIVVAGERSMDLPKRPAK
jgi:hypothetical protein